FRAPAAVAPGVGRVRREYPREPRQGPLPFLPTSAGEKPSLPGGGERAGDRLPPRPLREPVLPAPAEGERRLAEPLRLSARPVPPAAPRTRLPAPETDPARSRNPGTCRPPHPVAVQTGADRRRVAQPHPREPRSRERQSG